MLVVNDGYDSWWIIMAWRTGYEDLCCAARASCIMAGWWHLIVMGQLATDQRRTWTTQKRKSNNHCGNWSQCPLNLNLDLAVLIISIYFSFGVHQVGCCCGVVSDSYEFAHQGNGKMILEIMGLIVPASPFWRNWSKAMHYIPRRTTNGRFNISLKPLLLTFCADVKSCWPITQSTRGTFQAENTRILPENMNKDNPGCKQQDTSDDRSLNKEEPTTIRILSPLRDWTKARTMWINGGATYFLLCSKNWHDLLAWHTTRA